MSDLLTARQEILTSFQDDRRALAPLVAALVGVNSMRIFTELYILGGRTGGIGGQDVWLVMLVQQAASGADGRLC